MSLHVKAWFPVKELANFTLFTQPSAVSVTAPKWIDSWARLQFRFFLNLFSCLLTSNLSRRNSRSRAGLPTLFNFGRNGNGQWIPITFHVYSRYLAATRDVHSTATGCSFYDHDATQSECAHRLSWPRMLKVAPCTVSRFFSILYNYGVTFCELRYKSLYK